MKTYEFSTHVTYDHKLVIPEICTRDLPPGQSVQVVISIDEKLSQDNSRNERSEEGFSLETVIAQIRNSSQNPACLQQGSGLLAEHLMNSPELPDPSFDIKEWNQEWDGIEEQMKAMERAEGCQAEFNS